MRKLEDHAFSLSFIYIYDMYGCVYIYLCISTYPALTLFSLSRGYVRVTTSIDNNAGVCARLPVIGYGRAAGVITEK